MKKLLIVLICCTVLSCKPWFFTKYNSIYCASHLNETYTLYSGVRSYVGTCDTIEYQMFPCFTGTKTECKAQIENNDLVLDEWLKNNVKD